MKHRAPVTSSSWFGALPGGSKLWQKAICRIERALSLARYADLRLTAPQGTLGIATTAGRHRDSRLPKPGTVLRRAFRDQNITVHVLEKGFQYEGAVYRSLSAVARHISGTQWNGFSFFRLPGAV